MNKLGVSGVCDCKVFARYSDFHIFCRVKYDYAFFDIKKRIKQVNKPPAFLLFFFAPGERQLAQFVQIGKDIISSQPVNNYSFLKNFFKRNCRIKFFDRKESFFFSSAKKAHQPKKKHQETELFSTPDFSPLNQDLPLYAASVEQDLSYVCSKQLPAAP